MLKFVITDIDGTLTNEQRCISTAAIERIRALEEGGIQVILASGNTSCLLKGLCKLIGTSGGFIGENGGVYKIGYDTDLQIISDRTLSLEALSRVREYAKEKNYILNLYSQEERLADVAFARTMPVDEIRKILTDMPVDVVDTTFAIHIHGKGVHKGDTFIRFAAEMNANPDDFLAIGDSENDIEMLLMAGTGACVANATPQVHLSADYSSAERYGDGFCDIIAHYFPHLSIR